MTRTALQLAALASAAVPGLDPVSVAPPEIDGMDFDVAVVTDDQQRRWVVRAPRRTAAAVTADTESRLLPLLGRHLPVPVPQPAGRAALPEGGSCLVYAYLPGRPVDPAELTGGSALAAEVGRAIAALHDLEPALLEDAGLASYTADEYRRRRLDEVDRAAQSGHVPAALLTRWEKGLEDVARWHFVPTVVHGDLAPEHVLVDGGTLSAIIDWGDACVADPADDLAWVVSALDPAGADTVVEAYAMGRGQQPDRHLAQRAELVAELALARWLMGGLAAEDTSVVDRAAAAMRDLALRVGDESTG
ncbi:macrolide 2'-phosphotransferase [Angustibacter sp. McL0619]|uniref:macrolide 2'-phosphotransferase n=1 Tax=Angustibacter sp. McL0619 TaxID=3415676 RepID=UPI003CEF9054